MLPTELYAASQKAGFSMHKNYPYVATSKLVERGRAVKVGKRYRAIEKGGSLRRENLLNIVGVVAGTRLTPEKRSRAFDSLRVQTKVFYGGVA